MKYKYLAMIALPMMALAAPPVSAQSVSGSVGVRGTVAARCGATYSGNSSFSGTINVGELSQTNGTIAPALRASTTTAPAGVADFFIWVHVQRIYRDAERDPAYQPRLPVDTSGQQHPRLYRRGEDRT